MSLKTLQLTPQERRLRGLLIDVANHINESNPTGESVVLRWAGGWVRDKLLGIESHDIDIAINTMTGETFTTQLHDFCGNTGMVEKHGVTQADIKGLATIPKNPEKSKNLETSTTRLLDFELDFVNLRKEVYSEDSRNPQMEFGTAEEDALRRDATVNALFYNLHTEEIEDFTGGIPDMEAKLIRTPLDPFQTFKDDPLRVLRLVRFASRLEFTIDPKAEEAMGDPRILDALRLKISRERIGTEFEKMLKGNHPRDSLELIDRLGLYHTIFTDPTQAQMPRPDISKWKVVYNCLNQLLENRTPGSVYNVLVRCSEDTYFAWLLVAVTPWELIADPSPPKKTGKGHYTVAGRVAREGFKGTNKFCELSTGASYHRQEIMNLKKGVLDKADFIGERDRFGMAIRKWDSRGHWRLQLLGALLVEVMEAANAGSDRDELAMILSGWQQFLDHLEELDVMEAPSLKRLIDGNELARALGVRPGKWMKEAMDICVAWQLRNPEATEPAGAIKEVRSHSSELGIDILQ